MTEERRTQPDPAMRERKDPLVVARQGLENIEGRIQYWLKHNADSEATPYVAENLRWAASQLEDVVWHLNAGRSTHPNPDGEHLAANGKPIDGYPLQQA